MPHALIVAHGQPSDPAPAEDALAEFARQVQTTAKRVSVHSATLAAPSRLEQVLSKLPDETVVYPMFMAKGWFVTDALPKRLGDRRLKILDPLGIDPQLPVLAAKALDNALIFRQWAPEATSLVIAAHGSGRSPNPSTAAQRFAKKIGEVIAFKSVRVGFVEETPSIADAARKTDVQSLCLPFFAFKGGHVLEDIPRELKIAGYRGDVLPVVGVLPQITTHISAKLDACF